MSKSTSATSENWYNIDGELRKLAGSEPFVIELPRSIQGVTRVLLQYRQKPIQTMAVRLRRIPSDPVEDKDYDILAGWLYAIHNLEFMDPQIK
jgi:hypothetical protein